MSRRRTLIAALTVLLASVAGFVPPSIALTLTYSKGLSSGSCWHYLGAYCITANSELGMLYKDLCTGVVICVAGIKSGFASTASLGPGGHVRVGGHAVCPPGAIADLRVTITQHGIGAVAEGTTRVACTGDEVSWDVEAQTVGRGALGAGPATACGLLQVNGQNDPPDTRQWCRDDIELIAP